MRAFLFMTIPLCINCKYKSTKHYTGYCAHPVVGGVDVVYGTPIVEPCFILRDSRNTPSSIYENRGKCGPEGRLFEPAPVKKISILKKIYKWLFQ